MFSQFFQQWPLPTTHFIGNYDIRLVALSYLVAVFASYIALDLTGRLRDINNTKASSLMWLIGGAIAMGSGIWSMHFIGMLSFTIPGLSLRYDLFWTGLSLLVAILASGFALYLLKSKTIHLQHLIAGGFILGLAIASMHYTGMAGMLTTLNIHYLPTLFFLSIFIAIVASEAAIWLALKSNQVILRMRNRLKIVSAIIMGLAICGMHYTGMAAAIFTPLCGAGGVTLGAATLDPTILSMSIAAITFVILGIAYFASTYKEAINQEKLETARQLGMAEVAASVLHNVGNVLNSINVSTNLIAEKVAHSKLDGLENLRTLINDHKQDIGAFITHDPRGSKIPEFLNKLADYWNNEQRMLSDEIIVLTKNIHHIRDIISMQEGLTKIKGFEHIILLDEVISEAILITGLDTANQFIIEKKYEPIKSIITDKVKLLQILVNIFSNAKDALRESSEQRKLIAIKLSKIDKNNIAIEITDNGVGILPKNIKKIFSYGFTTKKTGHGYGLHTCAIAMNEIGGTIRAESKGAGEGATFILEFPYRTPSQ